MKKLLVFLGCLLCAAQSFGQTPVNLSGLTARGTLLSDDIFMVDDDAATDSFKVTITELLTYICTTGDDLTATCALNTDSVSANELNATGVEAELEAVLDLQDLQGAVTDAQVPDTITVDEATNVSDDDFGIIEVSGGVWSFVTGAVNSVAIASNTITEADVEGGAGLGAGQDGYVWAWNNGTGQMEFVSNAAGSESDPTLTDDQAVTVGDGSGANFVLTFNTSFSPDATLTINDSTGAFEFSGPLSTPPVALPSFDLTDSDTDDEDISASLNANCTATGTGAENCDLILTQQIAGSDVNTITMDADGVTSIKRLVEVESVVLENPEAADSFFLFKAPYAFTVTDIDCIVGAATSATIDINQCTSAGASCTSLDAAIACDTDGAADDGTLSNAGVAAGDWISIDVDSVSGTPGHVAVSMTYTRD